MALSNHVLKFTTLQQSTWTFLLKVYFLFSFVACTSANIYVNRNSIFIQHSMKFNERS